MGLTAYVYRSSLGDCSNGGVSGRCNTVVVTNIEGPSKPSKDSPGVSLESGPLNTVVARPNEGCGDDRLIGPMFGGCYIATSDSRFGQKVTELLGSGRHFYGAVALHDRYETQADYDALSR
jgi:hypothetical protein